MIELGRRKRLNKEEYVALLLNILNKKYDNDMDEVARVLEEDSKVKVEKKKRGFGKS